MPRYVHSKFSGQYITADHLDREFDKIRTSIDALYDGQIEQVSSFIPGNQDMLVYSDGTYDLGQGPGLYIRVQGTWFLVARVTVPIIARPGTGKVQVLGRVHDVSYNGLVVGLDAGQGRINLHGSIHQALLPDDEIGREGRVNIKGNLATIEADQFHFGGRISTRGNVHVLNNQVDSQAGKVNAKGSVSVPFSITELGSTTGVMNTMGNIHVVSFTTNPSGSNAVKWEPGHYFRAIEDADRSLEAINRINQVYGFPNSSNFKGPQVQMYWKKCEPTPNNYSFTFIHDLIDALPAGKYLKLFILYKSFSTEVCTNLVPSDIDTFIAKTGDCAAIIWSPVVMGRYIAMFQALAGEFANDPNVVSVMGIGETTPQNVPNEWDSLSDPNVGGDSNKLYSQNLWRAQVIRWYTEVSPYWPKTVCLVGMNYPSESTFQEPIVAALLGGTNGGMHWPDSAPCNWDSTTTCQRGPDAGTLGGRFPWYTLAEEHKTEIAIQPSGQVVHVGLTETTAIYNTFINTIGCSTFVWNDSHPDTPAGDNYIRDYVIPMLQSKSWAISNSGCPSTYNSCDLG